MGVLLQKLVSTIRVSLTPAPGGDRTEEEVRVSDSRFCNPWEFAASLRKVLPRLQTHHQHFLQEMAQQIQTYCEQMPYGRDVTGSKR